jgi:hypothetical protein
MSSNIATEAARGGYLLGQYGLFGAKTNGNSNTWPIFFRLTDGSTYRNVQPANPVPGAGRTVSGSDYASQGIEAAFDSGPLLWEQCRGWSQWGVQLRPATPGGDVTGASVQVRGTFDLDTADGTLTVYDPATGLRTGGDENWFVIPAAPTANNPITAPGQVFHTKLHLAAININVTAAGADPLLCVLFVVP